MSVSQSILPPTVSLSTLIDARSGVGKVALPVKGGGAFAGFEHVRGVPVPGGEGGYSLTRLKIIDSILRRMNDLGLETPSADSLLAGNSTGVDEAAARLSEHLSRSVYGQAYGTYIAGDSFNILR